MAGGKGGIFPWVVFEAWIKSQRAAALLLDPFATIAFTQSPAEMLSPEERRILIGILILLLFGAAVKSYRSRVTQEELPQSATVPVETLPVEAPVVIPDAPPD